VGAKATSHRRRKTLGSDPIKTCTPGLLFYCQTEAYFWPEHDVTIMQCGTAVPYHTLLAWLSVNHGTLGVDDLCNGRPVGAVDLA
jgi:hypothetical protein